VVGCRDGPPGDENNAGPSSPVPAELSHRVGKTESKVCQFEGPLDGQVVGGNEADAPRFSQAFKPFNKGYGVVMQDGPAVKPALFQGFRDELGVAWFRGYNGPGGVSGRVFVRWAGG
jgi:hypothetical protein